MIDAQKLKNGDVIQGIDTKDYIVRRITLVGGRKAYEEDSSVIGDEIDLEEELGYTEFTTAQIVVCPYAEFVKVFNVRYFYA